MCNEMIDLLDAVFDIKEKISDLEYKNIVESLCKMYNDTHPQQSICDISSMIDGICDKVTPKEYHILLEHLAKISNGSSVLPTNLKFLTFGYDFNESVNYRPAGTFNASRIIGPTTITFGKKVDEEFERQSTAMYNASRLSEPMIIYSFALHPENHVANGSYISISRF